MFKTLVNKLQAHFDKMCKTGKLFRVNTSGLWEIYIGSFKPGDDPIFRHPESTSHTCSNDKHFINNYGNIVAIIEGKVVTMWDLDLTEDDIYYAPCKALAENVRGGEISDVFMVSFDFIHKTNYEKTNKNQPSFRLGREKECVS